MPTPNQAGLQQRKGRVIGPPLRSFHPSLIASYLFSRLGPAYDAGVSWNRFSAEPRLNHSN